MHLFLVPTVVAQEVADSSGYGDPGMEQVEKEIELQRQARMIHVTPGQRGWRGKESMQGGFEYSSRAVNHGAVRDDASRLPARQYERLSHVRHGDTLNQDAADQGRAQALENLSGNLDAKQVAAPGKAVVQRCC
jgi:hypothetical protein